MLLALCQPTTAQSQATGSIDYGYYNDNSTLALWGSGKKETYDVAIRIDNPALVGTTIKGVTLYIPPTPAVSNLKVWMSKELAINTIDGVKQNVADITTQAADTALAFNSEYIAFDHPYTITSEGVYVGYTFTVSAVGTDEHAANPLLLCYNTTPGGFYLHTSRKYIKWIDKHDIGNLAMQVRLDGVATNSAIITMPPTAYTITQKSTDSQATITNYGTQGVQSLDLTYTVAGKQQTQHIDLPTQQQLPGDFGRQAQVAIPLPALAADGVYPASIQIDKVNGQPNPNSAAVQQFSVDARAFIPTHRTVTEEYTGTWCSNCPRGYAAMKAMKRLHPDTFIALAYHGDDSMMVMSKSDYPSDIKSFPSATIERNNIVDPYFGSDLTGMRPFHFEADWQKAAAQPALFEVAATAHLSADGQTVSATANVTSPRPVTDANYNVEIVLVGNDLSGTGEGWDQENGLKDFTADDFAEPEFAPFLGTTNTVSGLHFDDVVLATTRLQGTDTTLPTTLQAYQAYNASARFELSNVVTYDNKSPLPLNKSKLEVVALLIHTATGKVMNAAIAAVDASDYLSGIGSVSATPSSVAPVYYDLSGRRVSKSAKGILISNTGHKIVR